jgi:DNA-binding transcriptional regulator LsrR (DeoR family)
MPDRTAEEPVVIDRDDQLDIRIAWYYYATELTQKQIAERFGVTRVRVNKAIATCRAEGIVQVRINSKLAPCVELEHKLETEFGLDEVTVVPTPDTEAFIFKALGMAAGPYLHDQLRDGSTVGIGWGRTLYHTVRSVRGRSFPDMTFISLLGALNVSSSANTIDITSSLARLFGARYYHLSAPVFMDTAESRDNLLAQHSLREIYQRAQQAELALLTVGDLTPRSLMIEMNLISPTEVRELESAGAVGDLLGHFLDQQGREVDHPINRRVIALDLKDLASIKKVILVAGGLYKLDIIRAVLQRKLVQVLITDEVTAKALLE